MLENRLFTVFPIYYALADQNRFKQGYSDINDDTVTGVLFCSRDRLLPFQYRQPSTANTLTSILAVNIHTGVETEMVGYIPAGQLSYETAEGYTYTSYFGSEDLDYLEGDLLLACGTYYLKLIDAGETRYSEVFRIENWSESQVEYAESMPGNRIITALGTYLTWR